MKYALRRVRPDWQHPLDAQRQFIPLEDGYRERANRWDEEKAQWDSGFRRGESFEERWMPRDMSEPAEAQCFEDWDGERPDPSDFMPDWPESERTAWQCYEEGSEGTPVSPVMATPEQAQQWLERACQSIETAPLPDSAQ